MEHTWVPLKMDLTQHLTPENGARECWRLLPERDFKSASMLVEALSHTLGMHEDALKLGVKQLLAESLTLVAEVIDEWLLTAGVTRKQYLSQVMN